MKSLLNENGKSVFDVLVRSKITGKYVRTQCDDYVKYGNLRRFLAKYEDKIEVIVIDPAPGVFVGWNTFVSVLE